MLDASVIENIDFLYSFLAATVDHFCSIEWANTTVTLSYYVEIQRIILSTVGENPWTLEDISNPRHIVKGFNQSAKACFELYQP